MQTPLTPLFATSKQFFIFGIMPPLIISFLIKSFTLSVSISDINFFLLSNTPSTSHIGCQILSRSLFEKYKVHRFSISEIWNELLKKDELNGFESSSKFYHLTNLETFKKLKDL